MLALFLGLILTALIFSFLHKRRQLANALPPGPPAWFFFGNLLQFEKDTRKAMLKWHKKYGPMFTIWFGMKPQIMVTGYELMRELFVNRGDEFVDRPDDWVMESYTAGKFGIVNSSGEQMKEQRRFIIHTLRNFGLGKRIMEEKVINEAEKFVRVIEGKLNGSKSKVLNLTEDLQLCVGNIISSLVVGRAYEPGDPTFLQLKDNINKNFKTMNPAMIFLLSSLPFLRYVPLFNRFGLDTVKRQMQRILAIVRNEVEKHKQEIEEIAEPTDFTAAYLAEMRKRKESGQDMGFFSEWQLITIMVDLWAAGLETTVTTLGWAILFMMKYPDVQTKVRKELDSVIGSEKSPTLADKVKLPYVSAVLHEIQRYANIAPGNFGRKILKDTMINGYKVPAGTTIVPVIPVVHMDDQIFQHPEIFNPNRFLEADGVTLKKCDELVAFSVGKRSCLGESLARLELFIIFTYLMQKFTFEIDSNEPEPTLEPVVSFTVTPKPYNCLVTARC